MLNLQKLNNIGQIVLVLLALAGSYVGIEAHYAKASQLRAVELRLDQKVLMDRQDRVQERLWKFEDRRRTQKVLSPMELEEVKQLEKNYKDLDKALDKINVDMEKTK